MARSILDEYAYGAILESSRGWEVVILPFTSDDRRPFKVIDAIGKVEISCHATAQAAYNAWKKLCKRSARKV